MLPRTPLDSQCTSGQPDRATATSQNLTDGARAERGRKGEVYCARHLVEARSRAEDSRLRSPTTLSVLRPDSAFEGSPRYLALSSSDSRACASARKGRARGYFSAAIFR